MGRIAKLLKFLRTTRNGAKISESTVDPGGQANVTAPHLSAPGDDSYPLPGDYVILVGDAGTGRENAVGYLDPANLHKSAAGEKRIYARNASGVQVAEAWLKNDGSVIIQNDAVSFELQPDGTAILDNGAGNMTLQPNGEFNINGVRITTAGDLISASGVSIINHYHTQPNDGGGDSEQPTNPPTATE